jgi:hypothetical protein
VLLRRHRDRLRNGIWGRSGGGLGNTPPLGLRDSTPHPGLSDRQKAQLAEISERQVGLRRRSFGQARTPALQALPSLSSTQHTHCSSPCGIPRSHSTAAVPAG